MPPDDPVVNWANGVSASPTQETAPSADPVVAWSKGLAPAVPQDTARHPFKDAFRAVSSQFPAIGVAEGVLSAGSQFAAKTGSEIAGLAATAYDALRHEKDSKAPEFQRDVQQAFTYEPRTAVGQTVNELSGLVGKGIDFMGRQTGELYGGAARKVGLPDWASEAVERGTHELVNQAPNIAGARIGAEAPTKFGEAPKPAEIPITAPKPATTGPAAFAQEVKAAPKPDTANAQARADVLRDVGFTEARASALENNGPAAAAEYTTSRDMTTAQGQEANRVFENERTTLANKATDIVKDTGGTLGLDATTREARGNTILKPFESLGEYFDKKRRAAYDAAAQANVLGPIRLGEFEDALGDASNLTNSDRVHLASGLNAYIRKLKLVDENGKVSATPEQAETVRKYINENWSKANSGFAKTLKAGLDNSVIKAAGEDIYKDARATVEQQKNTLENPTGIGSLLDASGPNEINRKVDVEKVGDKIMSMPAAQVRHIMDTLDTMPDELQPQAKAAKAEIQAHMANRLYEAGTGTAQAWDHKAVNQFMDNNSARLEAVFGKDHPLLQDMNTVRAAGNILRVDRSYRGAAIQGRILRQGLPAGIVGAGGAAGGFIGGQLGAPVLGAQVGAALTTPLAMKFAGRVGKRAMQKRMTPLGPAPE